MRSIVGLPGLLCLPSIFDGVRSRSSLASLDARAFPDTDSFEAMAGRIASTLAPGTVLVGMSMGAYLALDILRRFPNRAAAAVLIGVKAGADTPDAAAMRAKSVAWARKVGMRRVGEALCDQMLGATAAADPRLRAQFVAMAAATGIETYAHHQAALAGRPDQTPRLAEIGQRVLVINGAEDAVTPSEQAREVARLLPDASYVSLSGVGHLPLIEAPDAVADQIAAFLRDLALREVPA